MPSLQNKQVRVKNANTSPQMDSSAEILNEEDLEDGEIFEDEDPKNEGKSAPAPAHVSAPAAVQEKPRPAQPEAVSVPAIQKKPSESPFRNNRNFDNERRENNVQFFNRGKRKHFDDNEEENNRWKRDMNKRNRRSHEFDREGDNGRARHDGEPGEDDEEMMFVRGASPHRLDEEAEKWERDGEEEDREVNRRTNRTFRGRGNINRRGDQRQRGRGRGRGGNMRGVNKRKREDTEMCVFFLQGKCHRGSECPYGHEIVPPRKTELCKFYMKDCCAKKEKCLYMHSEFPCKYFHMGLKCYANKKCKFNHGQLTDQLRNILAKHLDTAPKDILGEFPRRDQRDRGDPRDMRGGDPRDMRGDLRDMRGDSRDMRGDSRDMRGDSRDMRGDSRDMRGDSRDMRGDSRDMRGDPRDMRDQRDMRDMRDMRGDQRDMRDQREMRGGDSRDMRGEFMRNKNDRKSLFDIKVTIADEMRNSDGSHTPMPSPTQRSQDSTRSSDRDRDNYSPSKDRDRERDRERDRDMDKERDHEKHLHDKSERSKERRAKKEKSREDRRKRKGRREREKERKRECSKDAVSEKADFEDLDSSKNSDILSPNHEDGLKNCADMPGQDSRVDRFMEDQDKKGFTCEENGLIPQHLPKKQRELFLRIQQQQREAESSQASANDEDNEEAGKIEENWYSSDEETSPPPAPLPSILHNLTQPSTATMMPLLNLLANASAAAKPNDVNTPAPAPFLPSNLDLTNLSTVFEALTNLKKMSSSNQAEQQPTTTSAPTTTVATKTEAPVEPPKMEPVKPEPPRVRDPRLRAEGGTIDSHRGSTENQLSSDVDLRLKPASAVRSQPLSTDVDLRSLPFKPVQHSAASEIEASLTSHLPISWQLQPADVVKPDYSSLQIQPKPGVNDPRLRRTVRPPTDDLGLPRDPRQRLVDEPVRDPRARQPLLATPQLPPATHLLPPATPRYDEDHRPQFYRMDSDMRQFPPPTPRQDDEVYIPGPSRPVDPRQRNMGFAPRPDDIDLRTQMTHRVPFIKYNK